MIRITLLLTALLFTGCLNKHGVSAQYYSDCKEYYDLQGYYHKDCGEDDLITYEEAKKKTVRSYKVVKKKVNEILGKAPEKEKRKPNVW